MGQVIHQGIIKGEVDSLLLQGFSKLTQHDSGNALEVLLSEPVEVDNLVHPVDKLRAQEALEGLHGTVLVLFVQGVTEANSPLLPVAASVGGHDDNGVLKVHSAAVGIGDPAVVQNLQQHVEHVGMGLFDLVEENHRIGFAADFLGELARLVIAHIAGRRTDEPRHRVFLHKLGHIQPDQRIRRVEQFLGQLLDQLGLAHAGGAHEDEGHRLVFGRDTHPVAADGGSYRIDGLILADDALAQPLTQMGQTAELRLLNAAGGNSGPLFNDPGQIFHVEFGPGHRLQLLLLLLQAHILGANDGQSLKGTVCFPALDGLALLGQSVQRVLNIRPAGVVGLQTAAAGLLGHGLVPHDGATGLIQCRELLPGPGLLLLVLGQIIIALFILLGNFTEQQFLLLGQIGPLFLDAASRARVALWRFTSEQASSSRSMALSGK